MSLSVSVQAPARSLAVVGEELQAGGRAGRARSESRDQRSSFGVACRDVIAEVQARMAVRGYTWD